MIVRGSPQLHSYSTSIERSQLMRDCVVLVCEQVLTRIPSRDGWARFQRYASWVRVLYPSDVIIPDDALRRLSSATSGGPVCPQLRDLTWVSSYGWENMHQFLSPYLVSVTLREVVRTGHSTDQALASAISLLPTTYLEVLDLDLDEIPHSAPIHSALSGVVQRLSAHFRRLKTQSSLSDAAWIHLASLPNFTELWVFHPPSADISKLISHENAFSALERVGSRWITEINAGHLPSPS